MRVLAAALLLAIAAPAAAHPGSAIAVAGDGRVFFVDTGRGVFVIERDGRVVRQDGPALHWFAFDADRRFARTPWPHVTNAEFRSVGPLVLSSDFPVAIGRDGGFYFPQFGGRLEMIRIAPDGTRSVFATLPGSLHWLNGVAAGADGALYYTEDRAVRKIANGVVSTVVDDAGCNNLRGLAVAPDGTIYVAATGCNALLKIRNGRVENILRMRAPWAPTAVALSKGEIFVLEYLHTASEDRRDWIPRVRKITQNGSQVMLTK
jgi:streptogramin lyase